MPSREHVEYVLHGSSHESLVKILQGRYFHSLLYNTTYTSELH